ncbi:MAG TPA: response regulator [Capillibacterium sp.]|nr:response regulator transcription factor [Bacillota bacterium]
MFKVLIIDDEPLIREGLKTIVDWGRHGFTICGEAANGREGLRKVRSLQPDLLVLDIKMPAVDGLEMLATLRKEGHNVQALILTGYSEFAYAQQAINLGVLGYILKPIEEEELEAQLKKAYAVIAKLKAENPDVSTLSLVTEKIMAELCWGNVDPELVARALQIPQLQLPWTKYRVGFLVFQGEPGREQETAEKILAAYPAAVGYFAATHMRPQPEANGRSALVFILKDEAAVDPHQVLQQISTAFHRLTGVDPFFAVGQAVDELEQLGHSYRQARELFRQLFITNRGIFVAGEPEKKGKADPVLRTAGDGAKVAGEDELVERLCMAVDFNHKPLINELLGVFREQVALQNCTPDRIKGAYLRFFLVVLNRLDLSAEEKRPWAEEEADPALLDAVYSCPTLRELHEYFREKLTAISDYLVQSRPDGVIQKIIGYVQRNYHRRLKLEDLAKLLNYNPGYLGKIFKNRTGMSFQAYLEQVRLTEAAKLLQKGLKVNEVAPRVGYMDLDYFNHKFKKRYGVSPSVYKKSFQE